MFDRWKRPQSRCEKSKESGYSEKACVGLKPVLIRIQETKSEHNILISDKMDEHK